MTIENTKLQLAKMYAIWGHQIKADDGVLKLRNQTYANALNDIDEDLLTAAVDQLIAESDFFPSIAAIRKQAASITRYSEGGDVDPNEVFGIVLMLAAARGRDSTEAERRKYLAEKLPTRIVDITMMGIQAFGWQTICNEPLERMDTMRAQWRNMYNAIQTRRDDLSAMTPAVRGFISDLAQKLSIDRARLQAPRDDADDEGGF